MAIQIDENFMTLTVDDRVVATARFSKDAAADGNGAWIVSTHPLRLFYRNQAITALTLAELLAAGFGPGRTVRGAGCEEIVRAWHAEGRSQRAIARDLAVDRRKVKQIFNRAMTQACSGPPETPSHSAT